jgi:hypothetical protein
MQSYRVSKQGVHIVSTGFKGVKLGKPLKWFYSLAEFLLQMQIPAFSSFQRWHYKFQAELNACMPFYKVRYFTVRWLLPTRKHIRNVLSTTDTKQWCSSSCSGQGKMPTSVVYYPYGRCHTAQIRLHDFMTHHHISSIQKQMEYRHILKFLT